MQDHTKLHVWQRAHALSLSLHLAVRRMPQRAAPGLRPQLLRACGSIPANIAEGAGHDSPLQFARFLTIAIASANELESHLALVTDLQLVPRSRCTELQSEIEGVRKMLYGLRKRVLSPVTDHR